MTHTITYGDYVAMKEEISDAIEDARYEAMKHPDQIVKVDQVMTDGSHWITWISESAALVGEKEREHLGHEITDFESREACCYSCQVSMRWLG